ncbi:aminoacyl-tRNA hydrolase [Apibacter muscae]|uniref:Peptidyl-tRNA hydrolase n=1 Tax=Apibacter muscae TaxID=2509004 RepID=A0A563DFZ0_9FLAO|nr:aminoacyl-tRNA hydrolase [Apibacter muscae]TWP28724.1 aminoacyl-tRNA hydrolase [Apibacter muscae]TWP30025.1 aminoacyl-tRNA hydrolase [Apibacter muscae]
MNKFLIVGLGNIGEEYIYTRHNIGFLISDYLAENLNATFKPSNFGQLCETSFKGRKTFILKPNTFMNLSGNAVKFWLAKEKIQLENCLVICDDLSIPFGHIRLKPKGSSAGHNGLKSIENNIQSQQYPRLRFGIGNDFLKGQQIDYVLGKWTEEEYTKLNTRINVGVAAIRSFIFSGINNTMNEFNANKEGL